MTEKTEKNQRCPNFTSAERVLLIKLANNNCGILENKKTDAVTWRDKESCWKLIEKEFNSSTTGPPRTAKQLKFKYFAIKKEIKKRHSSHMKHLRGTGGGAYVPPPLPPKTEAEKILEENISLSVEGLKSTYDSDGIAGVPGIIAEELDGTNNPELSEATCNMPETTDVNKENIFEDWSSPSCSLWQTPKHILLKDTSMEYLEVEQSATENTSVLVDNTKSNTATKEVTKQDKTATHTWSGRRRPVIPKKRSGSSVAEKFEKVAEQQLDFINLQKVQITNKIEHEKKEHIATMDVLELRKRKEMLQIQLLEKDL